jgi:hypothetical protein
MIPLQIKPNVPLTAALVNPEGAFDFEGGFGLYETTTGQHFILPRPAVVLLNTLDPKPGEEIVITKHWSGKRGEKAEWTVALSTTSEKYRAKAEESPQELSEQLQASIEQVQTRKRPTADPTPIRRPARKQPSPEVQPRLFDRGTGTHGPAPAIQPEDVPRSIPLPAVAIGRAQRPGQIPANIAVKEILAFVQSDPNTANWGDQAKQDLCSTVFIGFVKQGVIGIWERS